MPTIATTAADPQWQFVRSSPFDYVHCSQPLAAYVEGPLGDRDIRSVEGHKLKAIVIKYQ
ncbi:MAG TPA: hypothetical protein DGQ94_07130 [Pseudomonas sp.]|nr:hypothetical protein [Pseudomonas sp.]